MAIKALLDEIENDVFDINKTEFVYYNTSNVPNSDDSSLTFERGVEKRGKLLESCVLYVDIRNSVALTRKHSRQTMGRIYTALTKSVLKIAGFHNGDVRNIIGDRIMVVFPVKDCFTNAVDCAISINHVAKNIIRKQFKGVDFKCGIGIDFGKLRVIKVGISKRGEDRTENKGLVWVGYPANIASRLTDFANKNLTIEYYEVVRNPTNIRSILKMSSPLEKRRNWIGQPLYLSSTETVKMSPSEFSNSIQQENNGSLSMTGGKLIKFTRKSQQYKFPEILMTESVFNGLKKENPNKTCIKKELWKEQSHKIDNVTCKVFGGSIIWVTKLN